MGLDLEWAVLPEPVAAARRQLTDCLAAGTPCAHEPDCSGEYSRLIAPCEFPYRRFRDVGEVMLRHGMAHAAEPVELDLPPGLAERDEDGDPESRRIDVARCHYCRCLRGAPVHRRRRTGNRLARGCVGHLRR